MSLRRGSTAGLRSSICSSRRSKSSSAVEESMASEESRGCFYFCGGVKHDGKQADLRRLAGERGEVKGN